MTTSPPGHHWEATVALTTAAKLQQFCANSREMTSQKLNNHCHRSMRFCVISWLLPFQVPLGILWKESPCKNLRAQLLLWGTPFSERDVLASAWSKHNWEMLLNNLNRDMVETHLETKTPTPNPEIPKKHRVYTIFFEKFARTFAFFPMTRVRNPTEIVQMNLFRWTFFLGGGDFLGSIFLLWHFVLVDVCSVDVLVACLRVVTGFKGDSSERRTHESNLVGQTKSLSWRVGKLQRVKRFSGQCGKLTL